MAERLTVDVLHSRWNDLTFHNVSIVCQQIGGLSSQDANRILSSSLHDLLQRNSNPSSTAEKQQAAASSRWVRIVIAMHFQLGKHAEFTLNDQSISVLLSIIDSARRLPAVNKSVVKSSQAVITELAILLLSLGTATTSATIGVENQLCALFLTATPEQQRLMLPLVHWSFYAPRSSLRSSSLSADSFNNLIHKQALDAAYASPLRLYALVHSDAGTVSRFLASMLRSTDRQGPKPLIGSAPLAVGLGRSEKSSDKRRAELRVKYFTVLDALESPTSAQVDHAYLVSCLSRCIHSEMLQSSEKQGESATAEASSSGRSKLSMDACVALAEYLSALFSEVTVAIDAGAQKKGMKWPLFCTRGQQELGLTFVEGVLSEMLIVAKNLCLLLRGRGGSEQARANTVQKRLMDEVTSFLYCAIRASTTDKSERCGHLPGDEVPELTDRSYVFHYDDGAAGGDPLFTPDIMIRCLEFQIALAPLEEVSNFFNDMFSGRIWDAYLANYESFPLELCMALVRNADALASILPSFAPRVMWLLSQQPHLLFPVVKRLIRLMVTETTSLDVFFRICFLPLICFSNHFSPPDEFEEASSSTRSPDEEEGQSQDSCNHEELDFFRTLWSALTSWESNPGGALAFAEHCIFYGKEFALWDALHRCVAVFDDQMTTAFRIIRPLLTEYFQQPNLPPTIFSAMRTVYFFMVAPRAHRHVVTDYLLEVGRWVAETDPMLVREATPCFVEMLQQEFIPPAKRSWQLQRWAAVTVATSLSRRLVKQGEEDASVVIREAALFFEPVHVTVWELMAMASAKVAQQGDHEDAVSARSGLSRRALPTLQLSHSMLYSASSLVDPWSGSSTGAIAADFLPESKLIAESINWEDAKEVWVAEGSATDDAVLGIAFSEHMDGLVVALATLSHICPDVRERGTVCLANLIRTLLKSPNAGNTLATTATLCLKTLSYPTMNGQLTMPLHALLGLQMM